jgi:HEAT repeat protein
LFCATSKTLLTLLTLCETGLFQDSRGFAETTSMTWKWIERLFAAEPKPFWTDPHMPGSLSDRLLWLLDGVGSRRWGARAAERLRDEVAALDPAEWARMDETLRARIAGYSQLHAPRWLRADDVRRLSLPHGTEAAVLGLLSAHPDGYVREAAVRRLALVGDGGELPPLLLRANDWVAPVRERAVAALHARVQPAYAEHWMRALSLVLRLRTTGRADGRPLVNAVLALLGSDECRDLVWRGLSSRDAGVRRESFGILRARGAVALPRLVFYALRIEDVTVRRMAAQAAVELDDSSLARVLPALLSDGYARVRIIGVRLAAQRTGTRSLPDLRGALLDRSAAVRAEARSALDRLDPMDFAAFYRDRVAEKAEPRLAEAVTGLAETGAADDADLVAPLVDHARPGVRRAALRALDRLAGSAAVPALVRAVGDASPSVSHTAAAALHPRATLADAAALEAWLDAAHPVHVRRNALSVLARRGKWDALAWILRGLADDEPGVRDAARRHLERWKTRFNRTFSQVTEVQRDRIRAALEPVVPLFSPRDLQWLRFAAGIEAKP